MWWTNLWGAVLAFFVGFTAAIAAFKQGREFAQEVYKSWWLVGHPLRFDIRADWVEMNGVIPYTSLVSEGQRLEIPFVLSNRGLRRATNINAKIYRWQWRNGRLGRARVNATFPAVDPGEASTTVLGVSPGKGRWHGKVWWIDERGTHRQRIRTPRWDLGGYN